ncbi:lamin tail domain-containing protein [bacterium]|nr:lamin tail domain-containing protein [candidate division CSSED10-310 bacterium]
MKNKGVLFSLIFIGLISASPRIMANVVINEILYDPTGSDTGFEFVELVNNGSESFDLTGFELKLADSNYYAFASFQLPANQRVVVHNNLTGDDTPTDLFTGPLANMGNTSGSVALFSGPHSSGNIVDFMQYGAGGQQWQSVAVDAAIWTQDDFTDDVAEGISVNLDPDGIDNNVSTDWTGCDPTENGINCQPASPTETPTVPTATPPPPTNTPTASTPPTHTPTSTATPSPTTTPSSPATSTPTEAPTITPTPEPTMTPAEAPVLINEVFYDPMGVDTGFEWIELINVSPMPVNLLSWVLRPDSADYFTFPEFVIESGARVLVHINTEGTSSGSELYAGLSQNMGNTSGSIVLFSGTPFSIDTIVDFVEYGAGSQTWESLAVAAGIWTAGDFATDVEEGYSLNRFPDAIDTNISSDWSQCEHSFLAENCIPPTATPSSSPTSLPTSTPSPTASPGTGTPTETPTATPTVEPTQASGVTINEVLYNPQGNDTGLEFIELVNTSGSPVELTGFDLKPDTSSYYTFPAFILSAGERVVVRVNTSGDNTEHELFTGPTSNMGNSTGFVALFNNSTHGASTIVDYVEFGAGGQTWESAAVSAGIWTAGDYVPMIEEGLSMNLDPDGFDTNQSYDWAACDPSMNTVNCETIPTASPTPTMPTGTPTATAEPTSTPPARQGVVINEILFDPAGTDTGFEFIELYNNSTDPVLLTGFDLKPDSSAYYTFPDFTLQPNAYVVVHVNTSGTDTLTDLYTGVSSNMGNSAGFAALFDDVTHSASTLIDYLEYGAGGQTWESSAEDAGIWTGGDYIPVPDPEGSSLNLCPNGEDRNSSHNWQLDTISEGSANTCSEPTPTPTDTSTPTPTSTPTRTPTPRPTVEPIIRLAGFGDTNYRFQTGGDIQILAWITDPENDIATVNVMLGGETIAELFDDGLHGDFGHSDGIYGLSMERLPPTQNPDPGGGLLRLQLRIVAVDTHGFSSHVWPMFTVDPGTGYGFTQRPGWETLDTTIAGSAGTGDDRPRIFMAGFMDTRVSASRGGQFTLLAVTAASSQVSGVELYYQGFPTGVMLFDNGQHNDFNAGDGVFGLSISIEAGELEAGFYPFQLRAIGANGALSDLWPYLTISE